MYIDFECRLRSLYLSLSLSLCTILKWLLSWHSWRPETNVSQIRSSFFLSPSCFKLIYILLSFSNNNDSHNQLHIVFPTPRPAPREVLIYVLILLPLSLSLSLSFSLLSSTRILSLSRHSLSWQSHTRSTTHEGHSPQHSQDNKTSTDCTFCFLTMVTGDWCGVCFCVMCDVCACVCVAYVCRICVLSTSS